MNTIQSKIITVGIPYIFHNGIKSWNMNEFAFEVGITKRTLYKYVHSKEGLIEMLLMAYINETQDALLKALTKCQNSEAIFDVLINHFPAMVTKMDSRIIQEIYKQFPSIETTIMKRRALLTNKVYDYLKNIQNQGFIRTDIDIHTVIEMMQALILYYSKSSPESMKEHLRASINIIRIGISPEI